MSTHSNCAMSKKHICWKSLWGWDEKKRNERPKSWVCLFVFFLEENKSFCCAVKTGMFFSALGQKSFQSFLGSVDQRETGTNSPLPQSTWSKHMVSDSMAVNMTSHGNYYQSFLSKAHCKLGWFNSFCSTNKLREILQSRIPQSTGSNVWLSEVELM